MSYRLSSTRKSNFATEPGSVLTWTEHRIALLAQRFGPVLYDKRLLGATRCSRYSLVLCLYFMGLNVSNEQIAHELSIDEGDAYQMTTALRGGIVKNGSVE